MVNSKPATLADVAKAAGVSLGTASKALNDKPEVRRETRERIAAVAQQMNFSHNSIARSLSRGRSGTVGLLTSDLVGRFSLPILMGAEDTFGAESVSVFLCDARGDAIREGFHISALMSRKVDALLVVGSYVDARKPIERRLDVPVVYVYTPSRDDNDFSVVPDNVAAGRLVAQHLTDTGRSKIGYIRGVVTERAAIDRLQGIEAELAQGGQKLIAQTGYGSWTEDWGRSAAQMLLAKHPDLDALICDCDEIARGALEGARLAERKVPEHVAIASFDNWDVLVSDSNPPITSVDFNLEELGRRAAETVMDLLEGRSAPRGIRVVQPTLEVRESTAPRVSNGA